MRTRLTAVVGLLVAALASTPFAPLPAAHAAPVLTMTPDLLIYYPRQVPLHSSGQTTRISVVVTSSEPVTVTARSYDGALVIADPVRTFGALPEPTTVSFDVAAQALGFHSLDIQMDGSSGPPFYSVGVSFGFVWTSGSPLPEFAPSGREPLRQVYGYQGAGAPPRLLTILSREYVHLGLPAHGVPTCTQEGDGCTRYWRRGDATGLVQIGTSIVGTFHRGGLYTDGFVPPGPTTGTPFGRYDLITPLYYMNPRITMNGTYRYADRSRTSGLTRQKVTFHKVGRGRVGEYRLAYSYAGGPKRKFEGKFRVERDGAITFRNHRGRVVQRGTVLGTGRALPCATAGTCRYGKAGAKRGIWLILSGRKGNHPPDGNLLTFVR